MICLGLLGLFQITIERLKCSKAISGWDGWDGIGLGWKSLNALILRALLCGANDKIQIAMMHFLVHHVGVGVLNHSMVIRPRLRQTPWMKVNESSE